MGPAASTNATTTWTRRVQRARELAERHPAAAELLRFYAEVLGFQGRLAKELTQRADPTVALRAQIDVSPAVEQFADLLNIVSTLGPAPLAAAATQLHREGAAWWREMLQQGDEDDELRRFFVLACLQPLAERLQLQLPESVDQSVRVCPVCGSLPQLIMLRPEGEGARRSLLCSLCLREWGFRRLLCPMCGELDKEKLPYYTDAGCKYVRVEACDSCHRYLKSVDLSLDGLAVPLVDEMAWAALDIWATNRGYAKIARNLAGI